ncbi:hypothetical protein TWF481_005237 [Arthrobotrys musiformis]|uniref:Uncharacterized protein n=1 Tax=Arthrobotrys musiformis TaxID=47236 RepID=A0AAV9WF12_9PEZI
MVISLENRGFSLRQDRLPDSSGSVRGVEFELSGARFPVGASNPPAWARVKLEGICEGGNTAAGLFTREWRQHDSTCGHLGTGGREGLSIDGNGRFVDE